MRPYDAPQTPESGSAFSLKTKRNEREPARVGVTEQPVFLLKTIRLNARIEHGRQEDEGSRRAFGYPDSEYAGCWPPPLIRRGKFGIDLVNVTPGVFPANFYCRG
jgi:hypothetical protein